MNTGSVAPTLLTAADCQHLACERRGAARERFAQPKHGVPRPSVALTSTTFHLEAAGQPLTLRRSQ